jgi:hypothetical protein
MERAKVARTLPGVEVNVVKEIVPQQLHPSGVAAIIGTAEKGPINTPTPVTSFREFQEIFGSDPQKTLTKEARMCFLNGVFEVFATRVAKATYASVTIKDEDEDAVKFEAQEIGESGNNVKIQVLKGSTEASFSLHITNGAIFEVINNVSLDKKSDHYVINEIRSRSKVVNAIDVRQKVSKTAKSLSIGKFELSDGTTLPPGVKEYENALEKLETEDEVEIVYVADCWDSEVHALVISHCERMSKDAKNRIGIGTVAPGEEVKDIITRTTNLGSDHFILVAPYGTAAAVAGLISKLQYFQSPTFKPITGISNLEVKYTPAQLMQLLNAGILPLEARRGRGIIIERGITTGKDRDQISVIRIADHAVRSAKNVSENFIGTLNTQGGRTALKEKLVETYLTMVREESIVPSVDGKDPAFLVDVYSSQLDFAQGIVHIDIAVRPVRAMDFIYATINVQA